MFQVSGQVVHVFDAPQVTNKQTGEVTRGEQPKVQLVGDLPLPNGQQRYDIITLTVEDKAEWIASETGLSARDVQRLFLALERSQNRGCGSLIA